MNPRNVVAFAMSEVAHVGCLLPVVGGLAAHGARVTVFCDRRFEAAVRASGCDFRDVYAHGTIGDADTESLPFSVRLVAFTAAHADALIRDAAALRPDIVVHDGFAIIGRVVAHALGVPRVQLQAGHELHDPALFATLLREVPVHIPAVAERAAAALRERYGLADATPFVYLAPPRSDLNIVCEPEAWVSPELRAALEPVAYFGSLPGPDALQPGTGHGVAWPERPGARVYVCLGTVVWILFSEVALAALEAISAAIAVRDDITALISLGGKQLDEATLRRLRHANVALADYVDQRALLASADAFVTHHGVCSTHEAVAAEVPMLSYPIFWDQPGLAAKSQAFGIAQPLLPGAAPRTLLTVDAASQALDRMLAERASLASSLAQARAREDEVIAARPQVIDRILRL